MGTKRTEAKATSFERFAPELRPVRTAGLTEHFVRQLKDSILRGIIKPGERFPPERDLAAMLKVSRSSLRQALKALQVMGVLEVTQGSGTYLAKSAEAVLREPPDLLVPLRGISFAELYEARRAMEAEAAASVALRATAADVEMLEGELARMRAHLESLRAFVNHDMAFHRQVAAASGNSIFIWFIELAQKVLTKGQIVHSHSINLRDLVADHEKIVGAVRQGDAERARRETLNHLTRARAYAEQQGHVELRVFSPTGTR